MKPSAYRYYILDTQSIQLQKFVWTGPCLQEGLYLQCQHDQKILPSYKRQPTSR